MLRDWLDKSLDFMVVLWSCSSARTVIPRKTGKRSREVKKGRYNATSYCCFGLWEKKERLGRACWNSRLDSKVSASDSLVSFDHSLLMVPELGGGSS